MKKFFRILAIVMALSMACTLFAACGNNNDTKPTEGPTTEESTEDPTDNIDTSNREALYDYSVFQGAGQGGSWYIIDALNDAKAESGVSGRIKYFESERKADQGQEILMASVEVGDNQHESDRAELGYFLQQIKDLDEAENGAHWIIARKDEEVTEDMDPEDASNRIYIVASTWDVCAQAADYFTKHFIANSEPLPDGTFIKSAAYVREYNPCCFEENDVYYVTSQQSGSGYRTSTDLVNWSEHIEFKFASLPAGFDGNPGNVEVHKINGKFYLVASNENNIYLWVADSMDGNFAVVTPNGLFADGWMNTLGITFGLGSHVTLFEYKGNAYVGFVSDWLVPNAENRGKIWIAKLSADFTSAETPVNILNKAVSGCSITNDSEGIQFITTEKGTLLCLMSDYDSAKYEIRDRAMAIYSFRCLGEDPLTGSWRIDNQPVYLKNIKDGSYAISLCGLANGSVLKAPDGSYKLLAACESSESWGMLFLRDLIYDETDDAFYVDFTGSQCIELFEIYQD